MKPKSLDARLRARSRAEGVRTAVEVFRDAPAFCRFRTRVRWSLFPFTALTAALPERGTLVDVGCGYGLLPFAWALAAPNARVLGFDPDAERIRQARAVADRAGVRNVHFGVSRAQDL